MGNNPVYFFAKCAVGLIVGYLVVYFALWAVIIALGIGLVWGAGVSICNFIKVFKKNNPFKNI